MILEDKTLYLRALKLEDAEGAYPSWFNDSKVTQYNSHGAIHYTKEMAKEYIQNINSKNNIEVFAIVLKENDQHIGNISLQNIDYKAQCAEYAILIGEHSIYSKGIGFKASSLLMEYAFNTLKLKTLYCGTSVYNIGMQKLALKLGFTQQGILKNGMKKNNQLVDIVQYELNLEDRDETL